MAQYLGKISAVISANTQDFTRNIGSTKKELDAFQRKLNGIRLNLDVSSFDKTLTKLQLFKRTMQEAKKLKIDVSDLERMHAVFEDVGKPLIDVKNDVEKLTNSVQAQLYPALGLIQKGFQDMQRAAKNGVNASTASVDELLRKLSMLRASVAVVKDIEGLALNLMPERTGATFVQPHAQDELKRSANLRDRAGKMSADIRSDPYWQTNNVDTADLAAKINKRTALIEKHKLALDSATTSSAKLAAAQGVANNQAKLDQYVERLKKLNNESERRLRLEEETAKQSKMFISASGGAGDKLDPVLEGAASDVMTARQFRGNFGADNVKGRLAVTQKIQQVEDRITALIRQRHEIEQDSLLTNEQIAHALDANRRSIESETDSLLRYTAAQSDGSANEEQILAAAKRRRKNTGSMGSGSFAGADLAFQQAAFAMDDFMSATGGVEYKIRAVSNNITQMGLMLGQSGVVPWLSATKGLFISLGVVMAGQVAVQFMKYSRWFQEYEKRGEILNDLLDKQRDKAKSAADAFGKLSEAIKGASMGGGGGVGADRREQVRDLARKNRESLEDRVAMQDPAYVTNMARQAALRDQQKKSKDPAQIAGLEILIRDLESDVPRLRRAALDAAMVGRGGKNNLGATLAAREQERIEARLAGELFDAAIGGAGAGAVAKAARERAQRDIAGIDRNRVFETSEEAIKAFEDELRKAAALQEKNAGMTGSPIAFRKAGEEIAKLERLIASLKLEAIEDGFAKLAQTVYEAADDIESAQSRLSGAIKSGVPMAMTLQIEINSLAEELKAALDESRRLRDAKDFEGAAASDRRAEEIANRRGDVVARARAVGDTARNQPLSFFGGMAEALKSQAETLLSKRAVWANESNRLTLDELNRKAAISGDPRDLAEAERFNLSIKDTAEEMLAATMASNEFGKALERFATGLGNTVASEMQGESEKARRAVNKADPLANFQRLGGVGRGGFQRQLEAAQADEKIIRDKQREADGRNLQLQQDLERERHRFELGVNGVGGDPADIDRAKRIRELDERAANQNLSATEQLAAKQEAEQLRRQQQDAFERTPAAQRLRGEANAIDQSMQGAMELVERQRRGREMVVSDTQKRREEAERKALDVVAALTEQRDGKDVFAIGKDRNDAAKTAMTAMAREIAPAFVGYGEEVKNAQLGGPSRQALNASDVTTMQGQSELSRLLRGDDPSKDINLVELQKQTAALEGIEQILINQAVVDLR